MNRTSSLRGWALRVGVVAVAAICVALLPGSALSAGPTNVSGSISTNTTWTLANSPYVMTGDVTVASGVTLTVEAGVLVKANNALRKLQVNGTLTAVGTASDRITFTSSTDTAAGQWYGIHFGSTAGSSTLAYVDVRHGGTNFAGQIMVRATGGALTIEDSTITKSTGMGLEIFGGTTGADASASISRTMFSGHVGTGAKIFNAYAEIDDSGFWENGGDGLKVWVGTGYIGASAVVTDSSIWGNGGVGVQISQDSSVKDLAPDGSGNAIYDNGPFGYSSSETWQQLTLSDTTLQVDWTGNYWGAVTFIPCSYGSTNGHLSYSAPDYNSGATFPVTRGPVPRDSDAVYSGGGWSWCANDRLLVNEPLYAPPDLHFDAPTAVFGGVPLDQTEGCVCDEVHGAGYTKWPVNTASGALSETAADLQLAGPGEPFRWTRSYTSRDTSAGDLGPGWTHAFGSSITVVNSTTGELEYLSGTGQKIRFTKRTGGSTGAATYKARGFDGTMSRLSGGDYKLVSREQRTLSFSSAGLLTEIKPRFLPATTLAYTSGKLTSITDSAGRAVALTYVSGSPTLIERVTLPDARYVEYAYTSGRLTSVRDARGFIATLAYDGNGRLTSIEDAEGNYQLQDVAYDGQGRVISEEDGAGEAITYSYSTSNGYSLATVTPSGRGATVYKYLDNLLISVTDPLSRVTSFGYDSGARRATETDGRGNLRRFEYDLYGNPIKEVAPSPADFTIERTFNSSNDVLTETDGRGNTTAYAYATGGDSATDYQVGQLKTGTDREAGVTTFKYWTTTSSPTPASTGVGQLKSTTDQRSKTTSFDYDSSGNLNKVTTPLGLVTTMGYDSSGRLTSRRDPRGNIPVPAAGYLTEWSYDALDHVATTTDARGNVSSFDYYDNGLLWKTTVTDRGSTARVTTLEYDSDNRLWKTTDPRSAVETRLYWPDGQLKSVETGAGRKTSYEYDTAGQLWKLVEPNGNALGATASDYTWTYAYDDSGNRITEAHPDGGTRETFYDELNRPYQWDDALDHRTSVTYDDNSNIVSRTNALSDVRTYTYDDLDRPLTETDERSKTTTNEYWATGQLKSVTTDLGHKTSYALDDDGRMTSMVEARGNAGGATPADYTWAYLYDGAGNRTRVTDPLGNYVQYSYDAVNGLTQVTDQRGNAVDYTYDVLNRLWKVTPPAAGATGTLYTEYSYDAAGNLATRVDPNSHTTSWTHDLDGLMTVRATGVGTWNYAYDKNGNLTTLETPAGSSTGTTGDGTITYGYDRMSRQTSVNYSDATSDVTRTFDLAGRPATMVDGFGTVTYTLDNADQLTDIARTSGGSGLNGTLSYSYDEAGNIDSRTLPDSSSASYAYDDDGRLSTITVGGVDTTLAYDEAGNLTSTTLPSGNGHVETRSFDRAGRLTTVENTKTPTILSKHLWTLDAAGNPTKVKTTRGATDTYDVYEYDTRNRLTNACYGLLSSATNCTAATNSITYAYDKVTNRTQEVRTGSVGNTGTIDYTYNAADQLTGTTKSGTTTNQTYDTNGNQASIGSRTFTYDLASRLASTASGGVTTTYGYDGDGSRVSSTVGGGGADLRYIWDPLAPSGIPELALERDTSGTLVRRYLNGPTGAVSYTTSAGTYSYHHDPLNTVTDVTDGSGVAQWLYEYEPYGASRLATNVSGTAPANLLRFNGQHLDPGTLNYHLRARQLDPASGRFGALDPVENRLTAAFGSPYSYVSGRPLYLVDPLGLEGVRDWMSGAARATFDLAQSLAPYSNPITAAHASFARGREMYATYRRDGALEAFNRHLNPAYAAMVATYGCLHSDTDYQRAYECANAVIASAALIGIACPTGVITTRLANRAPNLRDERGSIGGSGRYTGPVTEHGAIRLEQAGMDDIAVMNLKSSADRYRQDDGSIVYVGRTGRDSFDMLVAKPNGAVVTAHRGKTSRELEHFKINYGWVPE